MGIDNGLIIVTTMPGFTVCRFIFLSYRVAHTYKSQISLSIEVDTETLQVEKLLIMRNADIYMNML
jgi:hypothetical protein